MDGILSLSLPFFGIIFIGYACGKIKKLPADGLAWLNFFIIYVALPALFFQLISKTPFEQLTDWPFVATTTFATASVFTAALIVGLSMRSSLDEATIQGVLAGYSNVGYMGPGLTLSVFGPAAAVPTALIFSFDCTFFFVVVPVLMAFCGRGDGGAASTTLAILKGVLLHPFIVSTIAGIVAAYFAYAPPAPIERMLDVLMGAAAPCALFVLGVTVAQQPIKRVPAELPGLLLLKLIVHPVLVFVLLSYVGEFDRTWVLVAVLMAALPPALNVFVLAQQYETYVERASTGVLVGTVMSAGTVTLLLYAITTDLIPVDPF